MDAKQAITLAKKYVNEMFEGEHIINLGLEEVEYTNRTWKITIGFSRPWNTTRDTLTAITGEQAIKRAYRVVTINDMDGKMLSVKRRDSQE